MWQENKAKRGPVSTSRYVDTIASYSLIPIKITTLQPIPTPFPQLKLTSNTPLSLYSLEVTEYYCGFCQMLNISVLNALSIGGGPVAAVVL